MGLILQFNNINGITKLFKIFIKNRKRAVSPVLATVIIFGLIITGVVIVFVQVVPYVDQAKSEGTIAAVQNSFLEIDSAIVQLLNEAGTGGTPGGTRKVSLNIPDGKVEISSQKTVPDYYLLSISLQDNDGFPIRQENGTERGNIIDDLPLNYLDFVYTSPRDLVPKGSFKYMKGPNPLLNRDQIFLTGLYSSTEYQDLTNLTLSKLSDNKHHLTLNYRVAVHLSIMANPSPTINLQIFIIKIQGNFNPIYTNFEELSISCDINHSEVISFIPNQETEIINIMYSFQNNPMESLWDSSSIIGLNQLNKFTINIQQLIYDIKIAI